MEFNLHFCDSFEYPDEIKKQFYEILNICKFYKVVSVILTGSVCRGQLGYKITKKGMKVYSDFDFLIVTSRFTNINKLKNKLLRFEALIQKNLNTFKIDASFIPARKLHKLPRSIYTYDIKNTAIVIGGENIKNIIPSIDLENIDLKYENEYLIYLLYLILCYLPLDVLTKESSDRDTAEYFKYHIASSILRLVPIFLLYENNLITDIFKGVAFIKEFYPKLAISKLMKDDFLNLLDEFVEIKFNLNFSINGKVLYKKALKFFDYFLEYLFFIYKFPKSSLNDLDNIRNFKLISKSLFSDYSSKTRIENIIQILKQFPFTMKYKSSVLNTYLLHKSTLLFVLLLDFHRSLIIWLNNKERRFEVINKYFLNDKIKTWEEEVNGELLCRYRRIIIDFTSSLYKNPMINKFK